MTVALVLLATLRIVATYSELSHTSDEPSHVAAGIEWFDRGTYRCDRSHPPLARLAEALGPYLLGTRLKGIPPNEPDATQREGLEVFYRNGDYNLNLGLTRAGVLPFFWLACAVVYLWASRYWGRAVAALAVLLFTFVPPVLGHAGLATTDMALTASLGAAFLTGMIWLERPTWKHAAWFGAATGMMLLSKFSGLVFLPACAALALVCYFVIERPRASSAVRAAWRRVPSFAFAVLLAGILVWTAYRFSFGPTSLGLHLPAPDFWVGLHKVFRHNAEGHMSYLLGRNSTTGFPHYFEVALAVKTPLAFLALLAAGVTLAIRRPDRFARAWVPLAFAAALLLVGATSRINIGLRHLLPVYVAFSLVAAMALAHGLELAGHIAWIRVALTVLLGWLGIASLAAHPDYFPYFNELAVSQPEKFLVDSDLDWGQDINRAARRLRELGAREVAYDPLFPADLERGHGFPPWHEVDLTRPRPGWTLVSITYWKQAQFGLLLTNPLATTWVDSATPSERVGKGMLLFYTPNR